MDVQVSQHDSTVHVHGFSHLKRKADNHNIIRWCHCHYICIKGWELYKESMHEPQGSHLNFWLQYLWYQLETGHRPSLVATSVPPKEWDYNFTRKCSSFIHCKWLRLSWAPWVSLLQLLASNWVACHPGSTQTLYWSSKDHNLSVLIGTHKVKCDFGEPTNPLSIPMFSHIYMTQGQFSQWTE